MSSVEPARNNEPLTSNDGVYDELQNPQILTSEPEFNAENEDIDDQNF